MILKKYNDIYGHSAGDKVLKMVANTLVRNVRKFDTVGRWGGEEFIVLIENVNRKELYEVGEKLRMLVERSVIFTKEDEIKVTVSIGGSLVRKDDTVDSLIKRADEFMYKSKRRGKNCVSIK